MTLPEPGAVETDAVARNLQSVRDRIARACADAGRDPGRVRLLPVTKTFGPDAVRAAHAAGVRRVGENKVQELQTKAEALSGELPDLEWSVIGHLQTNKARPVAELATEFQALDSLKIARALDSRLDAAGRELDVLIQVNSSGEASKFGLDPAEVPELARGLAEFPRLRVRGLMTIAAHSTDPAEIAAGFTRMQRLQQQLRDDLGGDWDELSMGMSGDFELAIAHGSTCVRIGSAIFGARPAP